MTVFGSGLVVYYTVSKRNIHNSVIELQMFTPKSSQMQGFGLSGWPLELLVGRKTVNRELDETLNRRARLEDEVRRFRLKVR